MTISFRLELETYVQLLSLKVDLLDFAPEEYTEGGV